MITDTQFIKIQGVSKKGFFMRLIETKPSQKILSEVFVNTGTFYFDNANIENTRYSNAARSRLNTIKAQKLDKYFTELVKQTSQEFKPTFCGSLMLWKHDERDRPVDFPLIDVPCFVEHTRGAEIDDQVVKSVYDIQNKCYAIDALFESILNDLNFIHETHFDDNSAKVAKAVKAKFDKIYDDHIVPISEVQDGDWQSHSLTGILYSIINTETHTQAMVIPELRRNYYEDIVQFDEKLTDAEKQAECESYIDATRKQFGLGEDWR